jgi:hypothetical protein
MVAIVAANGKAIDKQGKKWGIPNFTAIAGVGSAVIGATVAVNTTASDTTVNGVSSVTGWASW